MNNIRKANTSRSDYLQDRELLSKKCYKYKCQREVIEIDSRIRVPKKNDTKGWKKLGDLIEGKK